MLAASLGCLLATSTAFAQSTPTLEDGLRLKREQKLPQAAEVFRAVLAAHPHDFDATVQLATVEGWMQHYAESMRLWRAARELKPHDADAGVGLARVAYWSGDYALAERAVGSVLEEFPKYPDALVLLGDVQMAEGHPVAARSSYLRAEAADANLADIKKKIERAIVPLRWRLDTGFSAEHFTDLRNNEQAVFEQLGFSVDRRTQVWLRHDYENRFDQIDNTVGFGASYLAAKPLVVVAEAFITPRSDFEPQWRLHLNADYSALPRLAFTADYRHSDYRVGNVDIYSPGVRALLMPWMTANFKYNVSHNTDNTITRSFQLRIDFQTSERTQFYLGYARGNEDLPPQAAAFLVVYSTGAIWNVNRRVGFRLDYSYEHRRNFYNHQSIGPGIRISF